MFLYLVLWNQKSLEFLSLNDSVSEWCCMLGDLRGTESRKADRTGGGGRLMNWAKWHHWSLGAAATSVFTLFSVKWTALHFPIGGSRLGVCVWTERETQSLSIISQKTQTLTQGHVIISYSRWTNTETWNKNLCREIISTEETRSRTSKKTKKGEHFLRVRLDKETGD